MNYLNHYEKLINRAKDRILNTRSESHHIVPRCMGGTDDNINLVDLTPEEHYTAHLLLVKIYPGNHLLIKTAAMMCVSSKNHGTGRSKNKLFGWLRTQLAEIQSINQSGSGNSQYGKHWINNGIESRLTTLVDNILPIGYAFGRIKKIKLCLMCSEITPSYKSKYCDEHRHEIMSSNSKNRRNHFNEDSAKSYYAGKIFITNGCIDKLYPSKDAVPLGWKKGRSQNRHKLNTINSVVE